MRSALNVTIGFGLASIPVGLAKLIDDDDSVDFRTLHAACSTPLNELKWCPTCEDHVDLADTLKGYAVSKGDYALFTQSEVAAAKPVSDGIVRVSKFCPMKDMPQAFEFLRHYMVLPVELMADRYDALLSALVAQDVFAVGQSVLWRKRRACVLQPSPDGGSILLSTVNQSSSKMRDWTPKVADAQTLSMAIEVVSKMTSPLDPRDLATEDPVRALVEARVLSRKPKKVAELKVATPKTDFQAELRASMQVKADKRTKVKR